LLAATLSVGAAAAQAESQFDMIDVRLIADEPAGGPTIMLHDTDKTVEVGTTPLVSSADVAEVGAVTMTEGQPGFEIGLTSDGSNRLTQALSENVGRTLAFIVDGKLLMAAPIVEPVTANGFLLTMNSVDEAEDLAAKIDRAAGGKIPKPL
jgi:preprotein translocase subunit SecD